MTGKLGAHAAHRAGILFIDSIDIINEPGPHDPELNLRIRICRPVTHFALPSAAASFTIQRKQDSND